MTALPDATPAASTTVLSRGPDRVCTLASYSSVGLICTTGSRYSMPASMAKALSNWRPCLAIIWSRAGSSAPRLPLPMAPLTVSKTGPGPGWGALAAIAGIAGNTPSSAECVRKSRFFIHIPNNGVVRSSVTRYMQQQPLAGILHQIQHVFKPVGAAIVGVRHLADGVRLAVFGEQVQLVQILRRATAMQQ